MKSPHAHEVEVWRRRAHEFLSEAREALRRGYHDLACFFSEQAVQLYLKSMLLELVGDYPRTHHIRVLLNEVIKENPSRKLSRFMSENRARISSLEDTYIMARYSTKPYAKEDAEDMIMLVEEIMELLSRVGVKQ